MNQSINNDGTVHTKSSVSVHISSPEVSNKSGSEPNISNTSIIGQSKQYILPEDYYNV